MVKDVRRKEKRPEHILDQNNVKMVKGKGREVYSIDDFEVGILPNSG